jgi:DNA-binding response OmpR family regulator
MMATTINILFADDDPVVRELVRKTLTRASMQVELASDGVEAVQLLQNNYADLVILDIAMPNLDGLSACREIRSNSNIPIMMLTAKDSEEDIVKGFDAGADDYLVKPFRPRELLARIQAIINRIRRPSPNNEKLAYEDLVLSLPNRCLTKRGSDVHITPMEFNLLRYFFQRPGQLISKEELFENVWGYSMPAGGMNLIEVAVRRLRTKIEDDPRNPYFIQSIRGYGYRMGNIP